MTSIIIRLFVKDYKDINNLKVRERYGVLSGFVGIVCNMLLFAGKFLAGIFTSSVAILADAFNNLFDAASSIVSLVGFKMSRKPADAQHPFGHGRIEYISGLIISIVIIMMGIEFIKTSVEKIINPEFVEFDILSIVILVVSVFLKLWLSLFNRTIGKRINSSTVMAISKDCISDVLTTVTVLIGAVVAHITNLCIDGYMGALVAIFIIFTGVTTLKETLGPLMGQAPDKDFMNRIKDKMLKCEYIVGVHDFMVHNYGVGKSLVSIHVEVPCDVDILKIHEVIDNAERSVKEEFGCEMVVHVDPIITEDKFINSLKVKVEEIVKTIDDRLNIHDFRVTKSGTVSNVIFDLDVPYKFSISDEELLKIIDSKVTQINGSYKAIVTIDKIEV